ncbi:major tail protein [Arthrobacter phage Liebe]|uniref:Major tail protein n=2 Tax=Arthrobacter virus Liebe TaxID=2734245 RepID=A0A3G2KHN9_9CAUD|nr:major tail protein [Arthrobacter phage Liebe]AYN58493.1 major tail protein [Arthrobacter phage Maureen]AZF93745.1 major tail protein [Arthrobacter phage Liebe]
MSGDAKQTTLWQGADVFIAPEGTAGPTDTTTAWGIDWEAVGLLDGEEGFTEGRDQDTSEHYAWGGHLYRRTTSKHKRSFKFVALEDNDVVFDLVNPGSTRTSVGGVRTGVIKAPVAGQKFAVGFQLTDGPDRVKRRYAATAEVSEVAEIKESESDPTVYEITVLVFPESDGTLYRTVEDDPTYVAP